MDSENMIIENTEDICKEKGELLHEITKIIEVLPISERQRVYDYLTELYFS